MKEQKKSFLDFVDPDTMAKVQSIYPQYTPAQHLQMISNLPPHLLDRKAFMDGMVKESSGGCGDKELDYAKKLQNYFADKTRTPDTAEQKQYNQQYLQHLKNPRPAPKKKEEVKVMDLGEAKREVWKIYKEVLGKSSKEVVMDQHLIELFPKLTLYFTQNPSSPLNLKKGLFIFGGTGVGKTAIFKTFQRFTDKHQLRTNFSSTKVSDIIKNVLDASEKKQNYTRLIQSLPRLIDDLGEEAGLCSWYGEQNKGVNLLKKILDTRYNKFKASGLITHISSNLNPILDELGSSGVRELYGDRLGSRFNEMFNMICLEGGDKRK